MSRDLHAAPVFPKEGQEGDTTADARSRLHSRGEICNERNFPEEKIKVLAHPLLHIFKLTRRFSRPLYSPLKKYFPNILPKLCVIKLLRGSKINYSG